MPADPGILGFSNPWYPLAVSSAQLFKLPHGDDIRLIAAPVFIAMIVRKVCTSACVV